MTKNQSLAKPLEEGNRSFNLRNRLQNMKAAEPKEHMQIIDESMRSYLNEHDNSFRPLKSESPYPHRPEIDEFGIQDSEFHISMRPRFNLNRVKELELTEPNFNPLNYLCTCENRQLDPYG